MQSSFSSLNGLLNRNKLLVYADAWKTIAGPALTPLCEFQGVATGANGKRTLKIAIQDPLWRQELHYQKVDLLKRYNAALRERGLSKENFAEDLQLNSPKKANLKKPRR